MKWHHCLQEIPFPFCLFFYLAVVLLSIQSLYSFVKNTENTICCKLRKSIMIISGFDG